MNPLYQEESYLFFSLAPGIGPKKFGGLLAFFGTAERAYKANESELTKVIGFHDAHNIVMFRSVFEPQSLFDRYRKNNISLLSREHPLFPPLLKHIEDPPICLYCLTKNGRVDFEDTAQFLAVVGSRNFTSYGKIATQKITTELTLSGFHIVSGLALGVDALAHEATINVGGRTTAVLGCGVDIVYPPANVRLRNAILETGNTIISEYPPGTRPSRGTFVSRNRIISGMCRGVLVVEGTEKSGTLITAMYAANQGRDVFAIPGQIYSPLAQAPLILLRQGAKLVTSASDILSEYGVEKKGNLKTQTPEQLTNEQEKIYNVLKHEPLFVDDIAQIAKLAIPQVASLLSLMEIEGFVYKDQQGKYDISTNS